MIPRDELLLARRIASKVNPRIKDWASLADRKDRVRLGQTIAEGARLVAEALEAPSGGWLQPVAFLVSDAGAEREDAGGLFARAGELGLERYCLADDCFAKVSGLKNSDGIAVVMAFAEEMRDLSAVAGGRWLVAAGVQDPGNAGALARTALAAGCSGCLFLDGADPAGPKFLRGSMGAAFRYPCLAMSADEFIAGWPATGGRLILASSEKANATALEFRRCEYEPPWALLVGGERGVPPALASLATETVHIPLQGGVESLNLAVAAGIILFEAVRCHS